MAHLSFSSRIALRRCGRLPALRRGVLLPAPGRAFRPGIPARNVSELLAGGRSAAGRGPGAARVRGCAAAAPAGAAPPMPGLPGIGLFRV